MADARMQRCTNLTALDESRSDPPGAAAQ